MVWLSYISWISKRGVSTDSCQDHSQPKDLLSLSNTWHNLVSGHYTIHFLCSMPPLKPISLTRMWQDQFSPLPLLQPPQSPPWYLLSVQTRSLGQDAPGSCYCCLCRWSTAAGWSVSLAGGSWNEERRWVRRGKWEKWTRPCLDHLLSYITKF